MPIKKKVLLMGKSNAGKTSMRSIIFASFLAKDTKRLGPTYDIEHCHVRFLGSYVLNLWDCGGQEMFMEHYIQNQSANIFKSVEVLIYVFDVSSSEGIEDLKTFRQFLFQLHKFSPQAKVTVLIHKMDLIPESSRKRVFQDKCAPIQQVGMEINMPVVCYETSIWHESLYKAWSGIVCQMVPDVDRMENCIKQFAEIIDADEVVVLEKVTFLAITKTIRWKRPNLPPQRFEKLSNILKGFKTACGGSTNFFSWELRNNKFVAFIREFTSNTFIMVVNSDTTVSSALTELNIDNAKSEFRKLEDAVKT